MLAKGLGEAVFLDFRDQIRECAGLVSQGVPVLGRDFDADVEHAVEGEVGVAGVGFGAVFLCVGAGVSAGSGAGSGAVMVVSASAGATVASVVGASAEVGGAAAVVVEAVSVAAVVEASAASVGVGARGSAAVVGLARASGRNDRCGHQHCSQAPVHGHRIWGTTRAPGAPTSGLMSGCRRTRGHEPAGRTGGPLRPTGSGTVCHQRRAAGSKGTTKGPIPRLRLLGVDGGTTLTALLVSGQWNSSRP